MLGELLQLSIPPELPLTPC